MQHKSNKCKEEKKALLHPPKSTNEDKTPGTSKPEKVTSPRVSAKVSILTTTANAYHKTTNATQGYVFHTMEEKYKRKKSCVLLITVQRHHSISSKPC